MQDTGKKSFEDFKEEVKYLEEYRKNFLCANCGSFLSSSVCKWCKTEVNDENKKQQITKIVDKLTNIISYLPKEAYFNETLNYLYNMIDVDVIYRYISEIDYKQIIDSEKTRINKLFEEDNGLTDVDSKNFEFIYLYCCNSLEKEIYSVLTLRERILKRTEFSMLFFEKAIRDFINLVCKSVNLPPMSYSVSIRDFDNARGRVLGDISLQMNRQEIKDLYNHASFDSIVTIYHEVKHLLQNQSYKNYKLPNLETFIMLKEDIVSFYSKYYYKEYYKRNYEKISFELDAQYYGIVSAKELANNIGNGITNKAKDTLSNELERLSSVTKDNTRIVEGVEYTVDSFFDSFIADKPELLEKYPYLKYQYVTEDGKMVRNKTQQELVEQLMSFNFEGMNQEEIVNTQFFLTQLISSKVQEAEHQVLVSKK